MIKLTFAKMEFIHFVNGMEKLRDMHAQTFSFGNNGVETWNCAPQI